MHPNAVMLAVVLLGNLMLPFISAQNGKKDSRCDHGITVNTSHRGGNYSDLTCVKTPEPNVSTEDSENDCDKATTVL